MLVLILVWLSLIGSETSNASDRLFEVYEEVHERNIASGIRDIALNVERYRALQGGYPETLVELYNHPAFNGLRFRGNAIPRLYYARATINDGSIIYDRFIIGTVGVLEDSTLTSFLEANSCGTNDFEEAGSFCPDKSSTFYIGSAKRLFAQEKAAAVKGADAVLIAFITAYDSEFSDLGNSVNAGDTVNIPTSVGYTGTANNCSGTFTIDDVVLSCHELFNPWGNPYFYTYQSEQQIAIQSVMPYQTSDGVNIRVIREAIL